VLRHLRNLSKDSIIYGLGGALARFTSLLLLPLFANLFTTGEYGIFQSVTNLGALLLGVTVLGLDGAAGMLYFASEDTTERSQVITVWVALSAVVAAPVAIVLMLSSDWLSLIATGTSAHSRLFALGVAALPFVLLVFVFSNILRFLFRSRSYVLLNLGVTTLVAVVIIFLVGFAGMGIEGALWGTLIGNAVVAALGAWTVRRAVDLRSLSKHWGDSVARTVRSMLRLGLPLVPASIALWIIAFSNTYFLIQIAGAGDAGVFRMGAQLASIVALVVWAFQLAAGPYNLSIARQHDAPRTYARIATLFTAGAVGISVLLAAFAPVLIAVFTNAQYTDAVPIVGLLSLAAAAQGLYSTTAIGLNLAQRTGPIAWSTMAAAGASLMLNALLIPTFGILGAGAAALAANLLSTVLVYRAAQRAYPIPYEPLKVAAIWGAGLVCTAVAGVFYMAGDKPLWASLLLTVGLAIIYSASLFALRVITPRELAIARASLAGALARRIGSG
jgi:O-antigen/teichoic acid export membrane protein